MRTNYFQLAPKAIQILMDQEAYLEAQFSASQTVNVVTWELVKIRISQINQCAFCVDMHSKTLMEMAGHSNELRVGLCSITPIYENG